jgi:integrator complex subunit 3
MGKMSLYESFAQATALGDLHTCLMMDMKACQEDDIRLLCYLTPSIYTEVHANTVFKDGLFPTVVVLQAEFKMGSIEILSHWSTHNTP